MQKTDYTVTVDQEGDGYVAVCREMDIASQGHTSEAARDNLKEVVDLLLECADASGMYQDSKARQLADALSKLDDLKAIASELFDCVRFQVEVDPEIHDTYYLAISVIASVAPREAADRRLEWYRRTNAILQDDCGKVALLIDIPE